jgi:transcriptional regulator GlxA family with amidase domain
MRSDMASAVPSPRRVLIVGYHGVLGMELLGARDMFEGATYLTVRDGGAPPYEVRIASLDGSPLDLGGGLTLGGVASLRDETDPVDTLIVIGGLPAAEIAASDHALVEAVRAAAGRSRRVVSTCSGAFLLAAAGLLDGRRATTHWAYGERLAAEYPAVDVETDSIYIRDGETWTSAGVTAAHDLVLALVEEDHGPELALALARMIVVCLRRAGGQTQFSVQLAAPPARRLPIREVQEYVVANPGADLSLGALAARIHLSPRHFARLFRAEVGISPGGYVDRVRLEAARRMVECTDRPLAVVAAETGFGTGENLRRVFVAELGVCPAEYRRRFALRAPQPLTLATGS